jgi:phospholipid transport system substrate-binding protein
MMKQLIKVVPKGLLYGIFLSVFALCALSPAVAEELAEPQQVIEGISKQLADVMQNNRDRLLNDPAYVYQLADEVLVPHVDFSRISSLVLGKFWRRADQSQKSAFSEEFKRLLVRTYSTAFKEFKAWEIRYLPLNLEPGAKDIQVRTQVLRSDSQPVDVVYRMHLKNGRWMAYDVKIEGISLITNYRSSFSKEVRRSGMDGLIRRIAELNDSRTKKATGSGSS